MLHLEWNARVTGTPPQMELTITHAGCDEAIATLDGDRRRAPANAKIDDASCLLEIPDRYDEGVVAGGRTSVLGRADEKPSVIGRGDRSADVARRLDTGLFAC